MTCQHLGSGCNAPEGECCIRKADHTLQGLVELLEVE